jgi:hypothetical protein
MADVVHLDGDLDWIDFEIPESNLPVRLVRLPSPALTLVVRFPEGWRREAMGRYSVSEEIVFLDGTLEMSRETYRAGDWAYVPAGTTRIATEARSEVLTLARFDGPARWHSGSLEGSPNGRSLLRRALGPTGASVESPLGAGRAWRLRRDAGEESWLLEAPPAGETAPRSAELTSLGSRTWASVSAGERFPALEGLCFCRTVETS